MGHLEIDFRELVVRVFRVGQVVPALRHSLEPRGPWQRRPRDRPAALYCQVTSIAKK
jgi:hypothetical protein